MHQEPQPQVMPGQGTDVQREPLAGPQAAQHVVRLLCAHRVVADERHPPLRRHGPRLRLGDVVKQRAEAQSLRSRELVGEGLGHERGYGLGLLAESRLGVALQRDRLGQHRARVVVNVEVVVAALLHAALGAELGQHGVRDADGVHLLEGLERPRRADRALELGEDALGCHTGQTIGAARRGRPGLPLDAEVELTAQPRQAQRSQRVSLEGPRRDHP